MSNLFENINEREMLKLKKILKSNSQIFKKNVNVLSNVNRDDFIALIEYGSIELIYNDYEAYFLNDMGIHTRKLLST